MNPLAPQTLSFFSKLKDNNNKEWFAAHKHEYDEIKASLLTFAGEVLEGISAFDSQIKAAAGNDKTVKLFRIYRDVRFSKNKRPYKTGAGIVFVPNGMESGSPGYYVHIEPGASFIGGGLHMPSSEVLARIRKEIDTDDTPLRSIITKKAFTKEFGGLETTNAVATAPKGYAKDHPAIDLLRLKGYTAGKALTDKQVLSSTLVSDIATSFKTLHPLIHYLESART